MEGDIEQWLLLFLFVSLRYEAAISIQSTDSPHFEDRVLFAHPSSYKLYKLLKEQVHNCLPHAWG